MNTLIITYDLANAGANYERLVQKIRGYPKWARLGAYAYLLKTDLPVVQVRDDLAQILAHNDKLFVGHCPVPAAWIGLPEDVSKWILANQPKSS